MVHVLKRRLANNVYQLLHGVPLPPPALPSFMSFSCESLESLR